MTELEGGRKASRLLHATYRFAVGEDFAGGEAVLRDDGAGDVRGLGDKPGVTVGDGFGLPEGLAVGDSANAKVGDGDGAAEPSGVGDAPGLADGDGLGDAAGVGVGLGVGVGVGMMSTQRCNGAPAPPISFTSASQRA